MKTRKNGIHIATRQQVSNGKTFKQIPNHVKVFATLTRVENKHRVWLMVPFFRQEIRLLEKDGWKLKEVWRKESAKFEN